MAPLQDQLQKRLAVASAAYDKVKLAIDFERAAGTVSDIPTGAIAMSR